MKIILGTVFSAVFFNAALSQNVGIGTNNPIAQFHTTGSVLFSGLTNNNTYNKLVVQDNAGVLHWRDASSVVSPYAWLLLGNANTDPAINFLGTTDNSRFVIKTNSTERINILGNGNIGIGVLNPTVKLDIYSEIDNTHLRLSGKSPAIVFTDGTNTPTSFNAGDIGIATFSTAFVPTSRVGDMVIRNYGTGPGISGASADLVFASGRNYTSGNNNGFEIMRLTQVNNKGRVGIGVTTPLAQLHTNADVMFTGITNNNSLSNVLVQDNAGQLFWRAASSFTTTDSWSLNGNSATDPLTKYLGTSDNTKLAIKTNAVERMTITAAGNVGINNINPAFKLEIESASQNSHLRLSGNSPAIVFIDGSNTATQFNAGDLGIATFPTAFVPTSKTGDLVLRNYGNGAVSSGASSDLVLAAGRNYTSGNNNSMEIMRLSQVAGKGKVGIGTTQPTAQLHTTDSIRFENLSNGTGTYLVIDAQGYVWKSTTPAPARIAATGSTTEKSQIEMLLVEMAKLRTELEEIKARLAESK